jgi:CRISPR/Cas system-associated endonuclease Cas1
MPKKTKRKMAEELLEWRRKRSPEAIMKRETFEKIKRSAKKYGMREPEAVAGKAYWRAAEAKYKKRRGR